MAAVYNKNNSSRGQAISGSGATDLVIRQAKIKYRNLRNSSPARRLFLLPTA